MAGVTATPCVRRRQQRSVSAMRRSPKSTVGRWRSCRRACVRASWRIGKSRTGEGTGWWCSGAPRAVIIGPALVPLAVLGRSTAAACRSRVLVSTYLALAVTSQRVRARSDVVRTLREAGALHVNRRSPAMCRVVGRPPISPLLLSLSVPRTQKLFRCR
ncbi:hypothetical protein SEVIR_4G275750v4 [Setaria viridis]